ncbi:clusterin-like [Lissotriton helveticus]
MIGSKWLKVELLLVIFLMGFMQASCRRFEFQDEHFRRKGWGGPRLWQKIQEEKEKSEDDHQAILKSLEEIRNNQQLTLLRAQDIKHELNKTRGVCNETMLDLWKECRPCLKHTCITYYAKVCGSGQSAFAEQIDEYMEHASPFSVWIQGDKIDKLNEQFEKLENKLLDLKKSFQELQDKVDNNMGSPPKMNPLFRLPFGGHLMRGNRVPRSLTAVDPPSKDGLKERSGEVEHKIPHEADQKTKRLYQDTLNDNQNTSAEYNASDDNMICKELRKSSEGCLLLKNECDNCKEILAAECYRKRSVEGTTEERYQEALQMAEKYSRLYENLLQRFQEVIKNKSSVLENPDQGSQLNAEFATKKQEQQY